MTRWIALLLCGSLLVGPARPEKTNYVALTFDDGPTHQHTAALLDGLYDRGVRATFLLCGYRMEANPELTRRIHEEGHEIGLHGYSHRDLSRLSRRDIAQELEQSQALLPEGCHVRFLRPPGGNLSVPLQQVARVRNLSLLGWSVDPRDWATADAAAIEGAVLGTVKDGDIILLHDTSESSVQAALHIVDALQAQGYEIVTVSELAAKKKTALKPGEIYKRFAASGG